MNYAFIGLGNMAGAILRGMAQNGRYKEDRLKGFDPDAAAAQALQAELGLSPAASLKEAVQKANVLMLCVKPQVMPDILKEIGDVLQPATLIVTIAAGLPIDFYQRRLPQSAALVRAMPSLNAMVMAAASALCKNEAVSAEQMDLARALFSSVGTVHEIPEKLFSAFSAIAGAAPAFAFQFVDALSQAGVQAGLGRKLAQEAASMMLMGSGKLLLSSKEHPRALMDKVASPGGTTIEGVLALDEYGFTAALHAAVRAVIDKDLLLGKEDTK